MWWPRNIGVPAVSPTRIWICCSKSGYEVTVVKDATASYSDEHMHAALEVNLPNYASAIVTTDEILGSLASPAGVEVAAGA
jgi:hypothetical protein